MVVAEDRNVSLDNIKLGWTVFSITSNNERIKVTAYKPIPEEKKHPESSGYLYEGSIKWDRNGNWESIAREDAHEWEVKQQSTSLFEIAREDNFNYTHEPWDERPNMQQLVNYLRKHRLGHIANRLQEVYQLKGEHAKR